jgi:L,D-peptidoglycan transpeptidase YkuD (ErfK/YbiS/YcfS/YnhG family)
VCQCPAGSAVTNTLRKDNLKLDVILNYNNASISQGGGSQE